MEMTKVFVYGTLLMGEANHRFLSRSKFLGEAIYKRAAMFDVGSFPAVTFVGRDEYHVKGELYQVSPQTLKRLDQLESHPNLYKRSSVLIFNQGTNKSEIVESYIWQRSTDNLALIRSGDWKAYKHTR